MDAIQTFFHTRKSELKLGLRVTAAALLSLVLALLLNLALPLWAVITSVVVTQASVGRSLKASRDYLVGTLGGAVYGGIIAVLIPHSGEGPLLIVLVLIVAPLAFLAAINPAYSVATVTALIVLLLPTISHDGPLASAIERLLGVVLGAVVGMLVSFLILPARAHDQVRAGAANTLDVMALTLNKLLGSTAYGGELDDLLQSLGPQLNSLAETGKEADRERGALLSVGPDPETLLRAMFRLRHDLVTLGRIDFLALPTEIRELIRDPLERVRQAMTTQLHAAAESLRQREPATDSGGVRDALADYTEAVAVIRQEGSTRHLAIDVVERFFALKFTLEQIQLNLDDLERSVSQWSAKPAAERNK